MIRLFTALAVFALSVSQAVPRQEAAARDAAPLGFRFEDVSQAAGLRFVHYNGAFGKKYLPETLGPGCAFLDFDRDGRLDILLINGMDWPSHSRRKSTAALYRNNGDGTFADATSGSGLDVELYGLGVAVGDFDNDGLQDLFITCVGQSRLFRNRGDGRFLDVTAASGLAGKTGFSTSALWFDYDRDGRLDLFVCNYVRWTPETDLYCSLDGKQKSYCTPEAYPGTTSWLFRNAGKGRMEDVTAKSGLFDATSKSLGVTTLDYDMDGWPDLFVSNDTQPNKLYRNNRNGTFNEVGSQAGVAFSEDGRARAGMGVDSADFDNSGFPGVVVTNFSGEGVGLYYPVGEGLFVDQAPRSSVGQLTRMTLGFGCFFFDADLDGLQDLLVVNGHIDQAIDAVQPRVRFAEPPHLFQNLGQGRFRDVAAKAGAAFSQPKVGRGAAFGDYDNDGDTDILLTTNAGPAYLFRNDIGNGHRSLRLSLQGVRSNRDGIGSRVQVSTGGAHFWKRVKSGSSYLSGSELALTFGLGRRQNIESVLVEWPSGLKQTLKGLAPGFAYQVVEGKGAERIVNR
ncbi:MAG: CRTAC1 family protein [Acidobacteriota bacterium]